MRNLSICCLFFIFSASNLHALTLSGFEPAVYGFVKASTMYSTEGIASFNNINMSAPTHGMAQTRTQDKTSRLSFQTQQSRIGTTFTKKDISARFEFDFVDFSKSSPTTQMNPRVRQAVITVKHDDYKFILGQDWDLFSPVTTFTFDFVGLYFLAGNTGFQRQQFQTLKTSGKWEFGAAIGMAGNNPGVIDNDLELSKSPSYSARVSYDLGKGRAGVSAIYARLKYFSNSSHHESYGLNAFFEKTFDNTILKSEVYYSQNLANIGALSIGKGTDSSDAREFGGTFSVQQKLSDKDYLFGGVGIAKIDNRTELSPFAMNASNIITSPGIDMNFLSRIGWERRITEDLSWVSEISRYETNSKLADKYELNIPYSFETGFNLRF